jgi:hypothetical protein
MEAAVGFDAAAHSMLTVLDDGAAQRTSGYYRVYRRARMPLAEEVSRGLSKLRQGFAEVRPMDVDALPLGGFVMVFHEVPLRRLGVGFVLDESETQDLPQSGGQS